MEPAGQRIQQFAMIDGSGSEIKGTQAAGFVALDMEFEAVPPAHAVFRFVRPRAKGPMLAGVGNVADGNAVESCNTMG